MDCFNKDDPSNISCTGGWYYWAKGTGGGQGEWIEDKSIRLNCKGIKL